MEFRCCEGSPGRFVCANKETYREVWPCLLSRRVPAARSFLRWAARHGAGAHCALRLRLHRGRGCRLVAARHVPVGRPLVSLPLALTLAPAPSAAAAPSNSFAHRWDQLESLAGVVARELHNPRGFHRRYLEFLHDLYNVDAADDFVGHGQLCEELEKMYMGNSIQAQGILNGAFLSKESLVSASQRVEWVRLRHLMRCMEQRLPHFASKSVPWAMSMVLSRALSLADGSGNDGDMALYPIIDFCLHSFEPNAALHVMSSSESSHRETRGVRWHDTDQLCAHLVAQRGISVGESITLMYSSRRVVSTEDAEYWKLRWGYVPN